MKRIPHLLLLTVLAGGMAGCISGIKKPDTYTARNGDKVVIESDADMCRRSCNDSYERCMDSTAASGSNTSAVDASGVHGAHGVFGASGDCRADLRRCMPGCKSQ